MGIALEGATTSNRYTILGRIAGGGMAEIFLARVANEAGIERHVVLKRVLPARTRDPIFAQMFFDEASLAAQLQHPNIAQVHDIGTLAGSYFFTMEYVHGEDVRVIMKKLFSLQKHLPESLALYIAAGALAALHHAHERTTIDGQPLGIVHRDVSPANVMVSSDGLVKLLDFGVAKAAHRAVETRAGTIKGKIEYLSPEQCQGKPIDRRSDIFSLGIVLHEMLVRKRLFRRGSDFEAMTAIVTEEVIPPSHLRPGLSKGIDEIVMTALEKDKEKRFATAADMLEAIETFAASERLVLTGTMMRRFMHEVFGERPLPWLDARLRAEAATREITVTTHSGDLGPFAPDVEETLLEEELENAPAMWRADGPSAPGSGSLTPLPGTVEALPAVPAPVVPPPQPAMVEAQAPPPPAFPLEVAPRQYPRQPAAPMLEDHPVPPRRRTPVIAGAAALTLGGVAIALYLASRGASVPEGMDAALVAVDPPAEGVGAPDAADVVAAPDAAEAVAATADAAVDPPAARIDAGSAPPITRPPPPPKPTLAETVAAGSWTTALRTCADRGDGLSRDDRVLCATAACGANKRSLALGYYTAAAKSTQAAIDRACRARGVTLVQAAASQPPPPPPKDPCEAHPLKCQK